MHLAEAALMLVASFHAVCGNVTFYSDGVDLERPDRVDEWTCRILTKPQNFGNLDLLGQGR